MTLVTPGVAARRLGATAQLTRRQTRVPKNFEIFAVAGARFSRGSHDALALQSAPDCSLAAIVFTGQRGHCLAGGVALG
jgi:hypothetical protein